MKNPKIKRVQKVMIVNGEMWEAFETPTPNWVCMVDNNHAYVNGFISPIELNEGDRIIYRHIANTSIIVRKGTDIEKFGWVLTKE